MTSAARVEELTAATLAAIKECIGFKYVPSRWMQMVSERGALDAHKHVLRHGPLNDGFVTLAYHMNPPRPELTAEYAALHNFPDLFTEEELGEARRRLAE